MFYCVFVFFFKQKTAYEMRISDWSSDVCSSDLSEAALDARSRRFRDAMAAQDDWHGTLVVTHWGFIRALTGHRVENCALVTFDPTTDHPGGGTEIGRESCRERVCQYV